MSKPAGRFKPAGLTLKVSPPAYQRLTVIKDQLERREVRQVTYSEVLTRLADLWEAQVREA